MYFFGGLAKLNADWFAGEPLRTWLRHGDPMHAAQSYPQPFSDWLQAFLVADWAPYAMAYGGCALDLFAPILLLVWAVQYVAAI